MCGHFVSRFLDRRWGVALRARQTPGARAAIGCLLVPGSIAAAAAVALPLSTVPVGSVVMRPVGGALGICVLLGGWFFTMGLLGSVQADLVARYRSRHPRRPKAHGVRRKGRR